MLQYNIIQGNDGDDDDYENRGVKRSRKGGEKQNRKDECK
jgi:hypothetical protein